MLKSWTAAACTTILRITFDVGATSFPWPVFVTPLMERIRSRLAEPLPGPEAWTQLSARLDRAFRPPESGYRDAGVLICLYPVDGVLHLPLMQRPARSGHHSRQISLPGGKHEADRDASLAETALREANEEMGIRPEDLDILGSLTPLYIPVSGFLVHPLLAHSPRRPDFQLDRNEVDRLIEVSLLDLRHPATRSTTVFRHQGKRIEAPCFRLNGDVIWGATAMILAEFLIILEESGFEGSLL